MNVIDVHGLTKRYFNQVALDGVTFNVERSEIFGIPRAGQAFQPTFALDARNRCTK